MSVHTSFHRFLTGSDFSTTAAGASSAAIVATSDYGTLLMALDSDHVYHLTQLHLNTITTGKLGQARLVSLDSDGATGAATVLSKDYFHSYTVNVTPSEFIADFNPPINVKYSSNANFLSLRLAGGDSDTNLGAGYSGFTTRA